MASVKSLQEELFEHDANGHLVVDDDGGYVLRDVPRKELPPLPDFDALCHTAAMDCDTPEEARDLLWHRDSNVTRTIYRAHFDDRRRANLRARMEARMEATDGTKSADGLVEPADRGQRELRRRRGAAYHGRLATPAAAATATASGSRSLRPGRPPAGCSHVALGAGSPLHLHHMPTKTMTVEAGRVGVQSAGEPEFFGRPGETVTFGPDVEHRFQNAGASEQS